MTTTCNCPHCTSSLRLPDDSIGKKVLCPGCKIRLEIRADEDGQPSLHAAPPRVPHAEPEPQAQEGQGHEVSEEEENRPPSVHRRRLRDRKSTPKGSKWLLGIAIFYLVVSTVVLLLYAGNQGNLTEHGRSVFLVGMALGYLITAILFGLHAYSRKQPVQACVIALALYTCFFLYNAITNPTLFQSPVRLAVAGIVFATLIMGVVSAYKQQAQMEDSVSHDRTASRREGRGQSRRSERRRKRVG